jgi:hypothetical protein
MWLAHQRSYSVAILDCSSARQASTPNAQPLGTSAFFQAEQFAIPAMRRHHLKKYGWLGENVSIALEW